MEDEMRHLGKRNATRLTAMGLLLAVGALATSAP